MVIDHINILAKTMKQFCLTVKTASSPESSSRTDKTPRELIGVIPSKDKSFIVLLSYMPSNTN